MRSPGQILRRRSAPGAPAEAPKGRAPEKAGRVRPRPARRRRARVSGYLRLLWVLSKDSVWRFKARSAFILASGNVSVSLQGAALALALQYGRWLEQDANPTYFGRTWEARSSLELLWLFTAGVAALLAIAAGLNYLSRTSSLKLAGRYEVFCSKRALALFSASSRVVPDVGQKLADDATVARIVRVDAREAGKVLMFVVDGIVAGVTLIAVFAALLALKLELTVLLLGLMALSGGFIYRVNKSGADASRRLEESASEASKEYKRAIRWLRGTTFPRPEDPNWVSSSVVESEDTMRHFGAYQLRWRVTEDAKLVANLVGAISFFVILGVFGTQIITSGTGFGVMAVYLLALRKGTGSFRDVNQRLTAITRHYPQVKRYFAFVEASQIAHEDAEVPARPTKLHLNVTSPGLDESLPSADVGSPSTLGLLTPVAVNRYSLAMVVDSLFGGSDHPTARYVLRSSAFATGDYEPLPRQPFRASVGIPADWDRDRLVRQLGELGITDAESIPELDMPCDEKAWREVTEAQRFVFAVLSALRSSAEWIFLDERGLSSLNEEQRTALLTRLHGRMTVVAYDHRVSEPGAYAEELVAVIDGERLIGFGPVDWFVRHRAAAEGALRRGPLADITRLGSIYEDEEHLDDVGDDLI